MDKPTLKREVVITQVTPEFRSIYFYASQDAADDFKSFGKLEPWPGGASYRLEVDPRFSFDEVVEYIRQYG